MRKFHILAVLLLILCMAAPAFAAMPKLEPIARFSTLTGKVTLQRKADKGLHTARPGMGVFLNDVINTGPEAKAEVTLSDGSTLAVGAESQFVFSQEFVDSQKSSLLVRLFKGTMRAVIKKLGAETQFEAPGSNIGIRGTEFTLTAHGDASLFFLDEGKVVLGTKSVSFPVAAGHASAGYKGRAPLPAASVSENPALTQARKLLAGITDPSIPASLKRRQDVRDVVARWLINYASYLLDKGQKVNARTALLIASELAARPAVRIEARMHTANTFAYRFHDPAAALPYYLSVAGNSADPKIAGTALFNAGRCLFQLGKMNEANEIFHQYLTRFPDGRNRDQVEFFISRTPKQY